MEEINNRLILMVDQDLTTGEINELAFQNGILINHLVAKAKSLESEFLEITNKH